jgi:plastocyanin
MKTAWTGIGITALTAVALASSGCTKNESSGGPATAPPQDRATLAAAPSPAREVPIPKLPSLAGKVSPVRDAGVIAGWVVYRGTPPKPKAINFGPEKVCADLNRDRSSVYETLVINPNSTVKGALVTIRGDVPGTYPVPSEPAVVDQVGCVFMPHVVAIMAGQEVEFRNSDPVSHNIRCMPKRNSAFNNVFATKSAVKSKFDSPELGIPLKCDIHFWMSGFVHVSSHPFFAITGEDGSFVISGVPPGSYTLLAWHETLKPQTQTVTVGAGEVKEVEFTWTGGD